MDGPEHVSFLRFSLAEIEHRGAMVAGLRELKLTLWVTKLRSDSSYAIYATRETCFAHL
jgi:hypothetical protein